MPTNEEEKMIPLHIIHYIDGRLADQAAMLIGRMDAMQREVHELTKSIAAWMDRQGEVCTTCTTQAIERCELMMDEALPTHPENKDATPSEKRKEHRKAHASWIQRVEEEMAEWKRVRTKVREWAIIGGLGVIALAVWQYLLKGPSGG